MSRRIKYPDENYNEVESEREYEQVGELLHYEDVGDYYHQYERRLTYLYMDPATGLVVADIAAYEKWMNR